MTDPRRSAGAGEQICRNCGRPAGPRFCGGCGQPLDDRRRPLLQLADEILDDWLSLDSRLLRTLTALCRPGRLTLLHRDGKRAGYLRPLRLYLLASLALFSTALTLKPPDASRIDLFIGAELISEATAEQSTALQVLSPDSIIGRRVQSGWADKLERFRELPPQQAFDALFGSLRRWLPAALVLFVPFLAAALKLLYLRTKTLYLDHLVFALHFQSALFLALAATWLLTRVLRLGLLPTFAAYAVTALLMLTAFLGPSLGRVHRQSRWWTTLKALLLTVVYLKLLTFCLDIAVAAAIWQA